MTIHNILIIYLPSRRLPEDLRRFCLFDRDLLPFADFEFKARRKTAAFCQKLTAFLKFLTEKWDVCQ